MEALGRRGSVALTHSLPRHYMGVSGQRHSPTALYPRGKDPRYPLYRRLDGPQDTEASGTIFCPCRRSNLDRQVVQSVVRHYTAWATPASTQWLLAFRKMFFAVSEWIRERTDRQACTSVERICDEVCRFLLSEVIFAKTPRWLSRCTSSHYRAFTARITKL
jgi:hypothetical protein